MKRADCLRLVAPLLACVLSACSLPTRQASPPVSAEAPATAPASARGVVLGHGEWFVIYQPGAGETLRTIATLFLGTPERFWAIADYNKVTRADTGQPLVVPLKPVNPLGVRADDYQVVPILAYHRFGAGGGKMVVSPASFAQQLEWLARNDYRVIPLGDLAGYFAGRQALPERAVVITIDDGYDSTYRHALPLLRKYGFPATVFVYTDFVGAGDALNWSQLQELAASGLVDIQAHSKTHRNLIERAAAESEQQYRQGLEVEARAPREILERRLPVQVRHYAFPYGDANEAVLDVLARQQYQLAVTVNPGGNPFFAQPLMLRRTMIFGDHGLEAFKARVQTSRPISAAAARESFLCGNEAGWKTSCEREKGTAAGPEDDLPLVAAFERRLRDRALAQSRQGRLADAALSWDVLAALRPEAGEYRERLAETRRSIQAAVPERLRRAQQAKARGDTETASAEFLSVLALQPGNEAAADALRGIERDRNRVLFLGKFSRVTLERRTPAPTAAAKPGVPADRNELEHAAMLGAQGEIDAAIALLEKRVSQYGADPATCRLLAETNLKRAQAQRPVKSAPAPRASSPCP